MNSWGMIISGYVVVFGVVLAYAAAVIWRGRRLATRLELDSTPGHDGPDIAMGDDNVGAERQDSRWTQ